MNYASKRTDLEDKEFEDNENMFMFYFQEILQKMLLFAPEKRSEVINLKKFHQSMINNAKHFALFQRNSIKSLIDNLMNSSFQSFQLAEPSSNLNNSEDMDSVISNVREDQIYKLLVEFLQSDYILTPKTLKDIVDTIGKNSVGDFLERISLMLNKISS